MMHSNMADHKPSPSDVVFVVEDTALHGTHLTEVIDNYVKPTLEYFDSGPAMDYTQYGLKPMGSLFGLVTFTGDAGLPKLPIRTFLPVSAPDKFLAYLDSVKFQGGNVDNVSLIAEGLACALQCFEDMKRCRSKPLVTPRHCVLLCNSLPLQLPVQETFAFLGCGIDQIVSAMKERSVHLSVICPRRLSSVQTLFEQAGGDVAHNMSKNFTKDPRHLVLLSGFSLQEQSVPGQGVAVAGGSGSGVPILQQQQQQPGLQQGLVQQQMSPAIQQQQQNPLSALSQVLGQPQQQQPQQSAAGMMMNISQQTAMGMAGAGTPASQRGSPVNAQQMRPMMRGQQPQQQLVGHQQPQQLVGMQQQLQPGGMRHQGPPNVTVQPSPQQTAQQQQQAGMMTQQQQWQQQQQGMTAGGMQGGGMPQQMVPSPASSVQEHQHSVLRSQLNKPTMAVSSQAQQQFNMQQGQVQMSGGGMLRGQAARFMNPQQQQHQQQQQQQQQQQHAMMNMPAGPSVQQQQQSQQVPQQQQPRLMGQPVHPVKIWDGTLEWSEKKPGDAAKQVHSIPCQLSCSTNANGEPEVKADNWPNKLMMQLINRSVISTIGKAYFDNIRSVKFNLQACETLDRLSQVMSSGLTGCVYFSSTAPTDVKVMMLLYAVEKQTYFGFIPNDQNGFIEKLKEVMAKQKHMMNMQQAMRQQQMAPGGGVGGGGVPQQPQTAAGVPGGTGMPQGGPRAMMMQQQQGAAGGGAGPAAAQMGSAADSVGASVGIRGMTPGVAGTAAAGGSTRPGVPGSGPAAAMLAASQEQQFPATAAANNAMQMPNIHQQQQQQIRQQMQQQQQQIQQQNGGGQGLLASQLSQQPQSANERQQNLMHMRQLQQQLAQAQQREMQYKATIQQYQAGVGPMPVPLPGMMGAQGSGGPAAGPAPGQVRPQQPGMESSPGLRTLLQQNYRPQMMQRPPQQQGGGMQAMMTQGQQGQMQPQQGQMDDPVMRDFLG